MPLSGALQADFGDFVNEAKKASDALGLMDTEAKKTGQTLAKTGQIVDGVASSGTGFQQLSQGMRTVDAAANAMGISLAKPIAMVDELSKVSGATIQSLGALGTAAAVAGTAMAAWEFGKWASEWSGMNNAIQDVIYSLDLTGEKSQVAALNAEILAKASAAEGRAITDLAEAREVLHRKVKEGTAAVDTAIHRQALWEAEIRKHRAQLPEITAALENHTATVKQLEKQYGMSAAAITFYVAKTKDQTAAQDELTRKSEAAAAAQQKLRDQMFGTGTITQANDYVAALDGVQNLTRMTQDEQTKLNTVIGEAIAAYQRMGQTAPAALNEVYNATVSIGKVTTGLGSEWGSVGTKVDMSISHIITKLAEADTFLAEFQAETDRMVQTYVNGQYGMAGATTQTTGALDGTTAATQRLSVAMSSAVHQTTSLFEKLQAGKALFESYQAAGVATGAQIGLDPYNFRNQQKTLLPTMSSTGNTLTVNVNNAQASDIANKLVTEMRHSGVRF